MNWYKKSSKHLWEIDPSSKEYSLLSIDDVDRMAFGFSRKDISEMHPRDLTVKYRDDLDNVIHEIKKSGLGKKKWALSVNLSEPIDVSYENGKFNIEDGHHRYMAALILDKKIPIKLEIKDKPHFTSVKNAILSGENVPEKILNYYRM